MLMDRGTLVSCPYAPMRRPRMDLTTTPHPKGPVNGSWNKLVRKLSSDGNYLDEMSSYEI